MTQMLLDLFVSLPKIQTADKTSTQVEYFEQIDRVVFVNISVDRAPIEACRFSQLVKYDCLAFRFVHQTLICSPV